MSAEVISTRLLACGLAVGLLVTLQACATSAAGPEIAGTFSDRTLMHGGLSRSFLVHDFSGGRKAPMLIILHGGGGNAENAVQMTGFDAVAKRERLIAVYPRGTSGPLAANLLTWNAGHCCAAAMRNKVDDVGFIATLIDGMVASGAADADRVYVTGMSNGGMMSHRLGIELSNRVAAIAPVVAAIFGDEAAPKRPISVLIINGAIDRTVPGAGGAIGVPGSIAGGQADRVTLPTQAQATFWAKANGCRREVSRAVEGAAVTAWRACANGVEVEHYIVAANGHAWPGGKAGRAEADQPVQTVNASEVIWAFFRRSRRG